MAILWKFLLLITVALFDIFILVAHPRSRLVKYDINWSNSFRGDVESIYF